MPRSFEDRHAGEDRRPSQKFERYGAYRVFVAQAHGRGMYGEGAEVLAQSNRSHFEDAAADPSHEIRVRFHPVDYHDAVRRKRFRAEVSLDAVFRLTQLLHVHRGAYRHTERRFADAIARQDLCLSFRRGAAVTAHCRNDERLYPMLAQPIEYQGDNLLQIGDPTATYGHRNSAPWRYLEP